MRLLLNEWFFHDLSLENGEALFKETAKFVEVLGTSEAILIVPAKKRWIYKAYKLMENDDLRGQLISKLFHNILRDSDRAIWTNLEAMQSVPQESYDGVPSEDIYLVRAYLCSGADLVVTTDEGLFDSLATNSDVNCEMRKDFLGRIDLNALNTQSERL